MSSKNKKKPTPHSKTQTSSNASPFSAAAKVSPGRRGEEFMTMVPSKTDVLAALKAAMPAENSDRSVRTKTGEELIPTKNQRHMMDLIDEKSIVIVDGTFGTGKTLWTCERALRGLLSGKFNQICLNAPAVPAGEEHGFIKGTLDEKMQPYVNQILEAFDDFVGEPLRKDMMAAGLVKIAPHAFLRGSSLKKTFFIADEGQNASGPNLQTAITRLGNDSTFVFMGDNGQNDRTKTDSAFTAFIKRYTAPIYEEYVGYAQLGAEDVKRHPFLQLMVRNGDHKPLDGYETHSGSWSYSPKPPAHS